MKNYFGYFRIVLVFRLVCLAVFWCGHLNAQPNIAVPEKHPYAKVDGGREGHRFTQEEVNQVRIYNFYQRQADYYMDARNSMPEVLPSYPGLDGGSFGHWGKFNQNNYRDNRWNEMGQYRFMGQQMQSVAADTVTVVLNRKDQIHAAFSPKANFSYHKIWEKGFVSYDSWRWGTSRGVKPIGNMMFSFSNKKIENTYNADISNPGMAGWHVNRQDQQYLGMYDTDMGPVFVYNIHGKKVLDHLSVDRHQVFVRKLEFPNGIDKQTLALFECDNNVTKLKDGTLIGVAKGKKWAATIKGSTARLEAKNDMLHVHIAEVKQGGELIIKFTQHSGGVKKGLSTHRESQLKLSEAIKNPRQRWAKARYQTKGINARNTRAYVVDDIHLPFDNRNKSLMFLTDIQFDLKGVAYITTLQGELYRVTGLGGELSNVVWQKMATGLNQPFGLRIWDGVIYVLEREQITCLKDVNGDGEIDFYGCFSNLIKGLPGSHTHTWGMEKDADGSIHFIAVNASFKISADGKKMTQVVGGLRNCMGFGKMTDGTILLGPQEGNHTPASTIIEVRQGDNHGAGNGAPLSIPLGYVPRGVDNSIGGFLGVDSKRWGPLGKSGLIGICYGYGSWYSILFDKNQHITGHRQVATIPMPGDFASGVVRGAVNPVDGQVYLVGLDGWGDYAIKDGCLHRIRYTSKPLLQPVGYEVFDNGIRVDFDIVLDAQIVANTKRYFAHMWNYNHARQYGSPEFSIRKPKLLGHDPLIVKSIHISNGGKSVFVEIPDLQPAMQMHLRMHMKTQSGVSFKTDLFPTIVKLGKFNDIPGAAPENKNKNRTFVLRSDRGAGKLKPKLVTESGFKDAHARKIRINTINGLKFDVVKFQVKANESIALELYNKDEMPHNLVICKPGREKEVGEASFKMLSDPNAGKKHYIPDDRSGVFAYTYVIEPKGTHTTYFQAPKEKGAYPFICTFPGHWQVMQGVMIVE